MKIKKVYVGNYVYEIVLFFLLDVAVVLEGARSKDVEEVFRLVEEILDVRVILLREVMLLELLNALTVFNCGK